MSKFQIDPKTQMAIMFIVGLITFLGTNSLPSSVPPSIAQPIHDWCVWVGQLYTVVVGPLMLAFTNSNPGPLAPADPQVVKEATAKAVAMGQMAKVLFAAFILIGLSAGFDHAQAKARVTCTPGFLGCPPVHGAPQPIPAAPAGAKDIFSGLIQFQGQVVADLQQADTTQAAVLNPATGAAWDPFSHMCLAGVPASGAQGQPGYIPASPGLIAWVQALAPMAVSSVPPLPDNPSAATLAVHARLLVMAAEGDANSLLSQINTGGVPVQLRIACGALVNDGVNQVATISAQAAAFTALLARYVAPLMAAHGPAVK